LQAGESLPPARIMLDTNPCFDTKHREQNWLSVRCGGIGYSWSGQIGPLLN